MREIKFRAWNKETKRYYFVECLKADGAIVASWIENGDGRYEAMPADKVEIEQYTESRDRRGREIYEGDIVDMCLDTPSSKEKLHIKAAVEFSNGSFNADAIAITGGDRFEVVGNIHEDEWKEVHDQNRS